MWSAEKKSQMYKKAKDDSEKECKELKHELEQCRDHIRSLEVDGQQLRSLQELADKRDAEAQQSIAQHKELTLTINQLTQEYELADADRRCLEEQLAVYEADLESTKDEQAKMMGHANHKQKVKYHLKIKDENAQLRKDVVDLRQRLSQFES